MSNYTDEEIGAALREYWEANGGDIDAQPPNSPDAPRFMAYALPRNAFGEYQLPCDHLAVARLHAWP